MRVLTTVALVASALFVTAAAADPPAAPQAYPPAAPQADPPAAPQADQPAASQAAPSQAAPPAGEPVELRAERIPADGVVRFVPDWRPAAAPRWAFALGGGGAWGIAHVSLLEEAERDGLVPDAIAGTSIGALVGGIVAAGAAPEEIERLFRETNFNLALSRPPRPKGMALPSDPLDDEFSLFSTGRQRSGSRMRYHGMVPDTAIMMELTRYLARPAAIAGGDFDRLKTPFRAVAADLKSGEIYAPRRAPIATRVRASIGLPIFKPVPLGDRLLVDGGFLQNVPAPVARTLGADVVVAVQLTAQGTALPHVDDVTSLSAMVSRSFELTSADQRKTAIAEADAVLSVAVGPYSFLDFAGHTDQFLAAGRTAWARGRGAALRALEAHAKDQRVFDVVSIVPRGAATSAQAKEIAERLGLPAKVSALRLEVELVRLLRRGDGADGRVLVGANGEAAIELEPQPPVRRLEVVRPPSLDASFARLPDAWPSPALALRAVESRLMDARRAGFFLAGVTRATWTPESGALRVEVEEGLLSDVVVRDMAGTTLVANAVPQGTARLDVAADALSGVYARGEFAEVQGIDAARGEDGRFALRLDVEEPPLWLFTMNVGASDSLGGTLWGRMAWPSLLGWKRWNLEMRAAAWRLGGTLGFEAGPPGGRTPLFVRTILSRGFVPNYTVGGDLQGTDGFWLQAAEIGLRTPNGRFGRAELGIAGRVVDASALEPTAGAPPTPADASTSGDFSVDVTWRADKRDDPQRPTRGVAWTATAVLPFAGADRARVVSADFSAHFPLTRDGEWSLALLGVGSRAEKDKPLPQDRWTDPGGWWEAPRLLPGRGLAPDTLRGTLVLRRELANIAGVAVVGGASAAAWKLGEDRADETVPRNGHGYSLFADLHTGRFGSVTIGTAWGSLRGNAFYLVFGPHHVPWPGPRLALPGR